jgi:hypothetical protein
MHISNERNMFVTENPIRSPFTNMANIQFI